MKLDYHMHFEYGDYDFDWVEGFFGAAKSRGLAEIGISEHSHTFPEFRQLYYDDLTLDDSEVGAFQKIWLATNKFKHTLKDYFDFMAELKKNHAVKIGIEVCNFQNQAAVKKFSTPGILIISLARCIFYGAGATTPRKFRLSGAATICATFMSNTRLRLRNWRRPAITTFWGIRLIFGCSSIFRILTPRIILSESPPR